MVALMTRTFLVTGLCACLLGMSSQAHAELVGSVFEDRNRDGLRSEGEPGVVGIVVSNGRDVVTTSGDGDYALPNWAPGWKRDRGTTTEDSFVFLTRRDDFTAVEWFRKGGGDFAIAPAEPEDEAFFIHISDVHAYRQGADIDAHYGIVPKWVPTWLAAYSAVRDLTHRMVPTYTDAVAPYLREAVLPYRDVKDAWSITASTAYLEEFFRGGEIGNAEPQILAAFDELRAMAPEFLINTGDIVFDSRRTPAEVSADWMALYKQASSSVGVPVHNTIGNHELGRVEYEDGAPGDPLYGPGFFEANFGPSYYSFDRGRFHFVALDTHSPPQDEGAWHHNKLRPEVSAWLVADLAASSDREVVFVNHEPFFNDPAWTAEEDFEAREQVALADVDPTSRAAYTLTGHIHLNGIGRTGRVTHIATGAISGGHWIFPPKAFPRGYRLVYLKGDKLLSAWKRNGEPVVGFIDPLGDAPWLYPGSAGPLHAAAMGPKPNSIDISAIAADHTGPFKSVALSMDGVDVPIEMGGDYFVFARITKAQLNTASSKPLLALVGQRTDGSEVRSELTLTFE
ncbi:MAG: Icc protein [Hyphomicrobiaceae bacterium]|jgi:Icc protein